MGKIKDILPGRFGTNSQKDKAIRLLWKLSYTVIKNKLDGRYQERFGPSKNIYARYRNWCKKGVWDIIFKQLSKKF